jgi:Mg2+/Co2+ transporter CorB
MDIVFVPDVMNVQTLMHRFIKDGSNIACVVDEFGGTAGIITLEDILEEIFGEIADEHDDENFTEKMISDNEYIFSGRLELTYLNSKYVNSRLAGRRLRHIVRIYCDDAWQHTRMSEMKYCWKTTNLKSFLNLIPR